MPKPGDVGFIVYSETLGTPRRIQVTVLSEPEPGMFRCKTDMGVAILVPAEDIEVQ